MPRDPLRDWDIFAEPDASELLGRIQGLEGIPSLEIILRKVGKSVYCFGSHHVSIIVLSLRKIQQDVKLDGHRRQWTPTSAPSLGKCRAVLIMMMIAQKHLASLNYTHDTLMAS